MEQKQSHAHGKDRCSVLKKWTGSFVAVLIAMLIWVPRIHFFYQPTIEEFFSTHSVPLKAGMLAARHLDIWTDPALRQQELQKMQARNPEWAFMSRTYFVLALANMALRDDAYTSQALEIIDTIIDNTLKIEQEKGFEHFLLGYAAAGRWNVQPPRSLFVDGEIALMLAARRAIEERLEYQPLLAARIERMIAQMEQSPVLCGESYPDECWIFCNTVALAAIRLADVLDGTDHSQFLAAWLQTAQRELLEPTTGLLISTFAVNGTPLPAGFGPEGSSIWMACHMLQIVDPEFAQDQYERARKELGRTVWGFGYSREWPTTVPGTPDIDSGPVVPGFGASASASGLAILAAAAFDDTDYLVHLITSLNFAGFPAETDGQLRYQASNPVGDAVMLYAMLEGPLWDFVHRRSQQ
jgi:hypothetical protein